MQSQGNNKQQGRSASANIRRARKLKNTRKA
jgi:hypothetical protein